MFGTDHLFGSFEFDTDLKRAEDGQWTASALGVSATHYDQSQAVNNLNQKINEKLERGEIRPDILGG